MNPLMRFDGYFVAADLARVQNLQSRALELARWKMREWLFGFGNPCPDTLRGNMRASVAAFGFATMIYRLVLFTGIAIAVYYMFFKALGVFLFLVEIGYFIVLPIYRELRAWWQMRATLARRSRFWISATAAAAIFIAAFLPLSRSVSVPVVLEPANYVHIFPKVAAEIRSVSVSPGQLISENDSLAVLSSRKLEKELVVNQAKLALIDERIARRIGDSKDRAATLSLDKDRLSVLEKIDAIIRQIETLTIRAGMRGVVAELDSNLHPGRNLARDDEIGIVIADGKPLVRGYAGEVEIIRLSAGAQGIFVSDDDPTLRFPVRLTEFSLAPSSSIDIPQLAESYGGKIRNFAPAQRSPLVPVDPIYQVNLTPEDGVAQPPRALRGVVALEAAPQSFAASAWRRVLKILVREAGA